VGENDTRRESDRHEETDLERFNEAIGRGIDPAEAQREIVQDQVMRMRADLFSELIAKGYSSDRAAKEIYGDKTATNDEEILTLDEYNNLIATGLTIEEAFAKLNSNIREEDEERRAREEQYNTLIWGGMDPEMAAAAILGFSIDETGYTLTHEYEYDPNTIPTTVLRRAASATAGFISVWDIDTEDDTITYDSSESDTQTFIHTAEAKTSAYTPTKQEKERLRLDPSVRLISQDEITKLFESSLYTATAKEVLMSHADFQPSGGIELDGKKFMFSNIFKGYYGYENVILYETEDTKNDILPRLYYKSKSDGGWRATPGLASSGHINKGYDPRTVNEHGHYVQTTRPDENIIAYLEQLKNDQDEITTIESGTKAYIDLIESFSLERATQDGSLTFPNEVEYVEVTSAGLGGYLSGYGLAPNRDEGLNALMNMRLPMDFEPDFHQKPLQVYATEHTLLGEIALEVYPAAFNGREIEWHIARDGDGRMWIDRIQFTDSKLTSYGTRAEVILAGALSAKPLDYRHQAVNMILGSSQPDARYFNDDYVDVTPLLKKLPPLVRYQQAKGLLQNSFKTPVADTLSGALQ